MNTINEPVSINDTLDVSGDFRVNTNKFTVDSATGNITSSGTLTTANISRYIFIPVSAMTKDTTADQDPDDSFSSDAAALSFNDAETNIVRFGLAVPENWNAGTNVVVELIWTSTTIVGNVEWEISWASIPTNNTETAASDGTDTYIDAAPTTESFVLSTGTNLAISSGTVTAGDTMFIKITRDATSGNADDTMAGNALLLGAKITYTATR